MNLLLVDMSPEAVQIILVGLNGLQNADIAVVVAIIIDSVIQILMIRKVLSEEE